MIHATPSRTPPSPAVPLPAPTTPRSEARAVRHLHRERDFGVGYGNSSGYASYRRYSSNWIQPRFRVG